MSAIRKTTSVMTASPLAGLALRRNSSVTPTRLGSYVSPSSQRHVSVMGASPHNLRDVSDEAEMRHRRRSKVMPGSNLASPAALSEGRKSLPLSDVSNVQLADHYADCIKLSAENKINAKNAFTLHLIDYMSDQLRRKDATNFQMASSSLDASAKIYAGRVDAIHTEAYKMLGGLGRGNDEKNKQTDENGEELENTEEASDERKKRKKTKKKKTIEHNLKNITVDNFDLEFEVDPLFHKTSASFDEGGTSGMLLNYLRCRDDSCELLLDSNIVINPSKQTTESSQAKPVDLKDFADFFTNITREGLQICPPFADFEFTNWNSEKKDTLFEQMVKESHAFDLDADPEPIPDTASDDAPGEDDYIDDIEDADSLTQYSEGLADGREARLVSTNDGVRHGTVGTLVQVLASEPGEYSYFNSNLLATWAGPSHWRLKPQSKDPRFAKKTTRKNIKKLPYKTDYSTEVDFSAHFKETKAITTLSKKRLEKFVRSQAILPPDLHYDPETLFKLFIKPKTMVKRHIGVDNIDDAVRNYDYDNANDKENFCPFDPVADDDPDDDAGHFELSQGSDMSQQASCVADNTLINNTMFSGDNLISQPNKVAKIDIDYARTAKKIDVKKLKSSMWGILTTKEKEEDTNKEKERSHVVGNHTLKDLLEELPGIVSKNMATNLSVPIAFVCLLHLANEKGLRLLGDESMSNVQISQDI